MVILQYSTFLGRGGREKTLCGQLEPNKNDFMCFMRCKALASPGAGPSPATQKGLAEVISLNVHILAPDLQYTLVPAQLKWPQTPDVLEAMVGFEFFEKLLSDLFFVLI